MRDTLLEVVVRAHDDVAEVEVSGEIDVANAHELQSELAAVCATCHLVAVDLRDVGFMDLCGLRALECVEAQAHRDGRSFVVATSPAVDRVIRVSQAVPDG